MDTGEAVKVAGHKPDFELLLEQILVAVASTPPSEEQWVVCFAMERLLERQRPLAPPVVCSEVVWEMATDGEYRSPGHPIPCGIPCGGPCELSAWSRLRR